MSPQRPEILDGLFGIDPQIPSSDLHAVWADYQRARRARLDPLHAAVQVASRVDRLGLAFAVGYPAALQQMLPGLDFPCALCVTESEGNHPRAIRTTLRRTPAGYRLDGEKTFVTFGDRASRLLVAARAGEQPDGRPEIALVNIGADRGGVELSGRPPSPFVPEVPHARLTLNAVQVGDGERLPGDGYLRYVKPFRTIEDIHLLASTAAYLIGLLRRTEGPASLLARLGALLIALDALRQAEPLDPHVHLALHGIHETLMDLLAGEPFSAAWAAADEEERERWERDQVLLSVASSAREARFRKASSQLGLQAE